MTSFEEPSVEMCGDLADAADPIRGEVGHQMEDGERRHGRAERAIAAQ